MLEGFVKGVSKAKYMCRECYKQRDEFHKKPYIGDLRTIEQHENDLLSVSDKNYKGVLKLTPLVNIPYFNIAKDLPHDTMHIIFEGLGKYHLIDILQSILDGPGEQRTTIQEINTRIKLFNFGRSKSRNRPSGIKDNILDDNPSLSMTASQTWNMVLLLPFIIDDIIDITHPDYNFFNMLRLIILISFSNTIRMSDIIILERTIENYYSAYIKHETMSNVPKLHYLLHLVADIKR